MVGLDKTSTENVVHVANRRPVHSIPNPTVVVDDCNAGRKREQLDVLLHHQTQERTAAVAVARVDAIAGNSASEKWAAFLVSIGSIPFRLDWM